MQNCSVASHNTPVSQREGFQGASPAAPSLRQEAVLGHQQKPGLFRFRWGGRGGVFWASLSECCRFKPNGQKVQFTLKSATKPYSIFLVGTTRFSRANGRVPAPQAFVLETLGRVPAQIRLKGSGGSVGRRLGRGRGAAAGQGGAQRLGDGEARSTCARPRRAPQGAATCACG